MILEHHDLVAYKSIIFLEARLSFKIMVSPTHVFVKRREKQTLNFSYVRMVLNHKHLLRYHKKYSFYKI